MALLELKVEIAPAGAAAADDVLLEHGLEAWSVFHEVVLGRAWLMGIGEDRVELEAQWRRLGPLLAAAGIQPVAGPEVRELRDQDWRDSYKAHFRAWKFGRLHWVPVWERAAYVVPPGDAVLWLDPGLAFGTGNHETTRLCVERLVALAEDHGTDGRVIDAGCGSGILALSAVQLGYRDVAGFDNDSEAVRISGENAALNGLAGKVCFFTADLDAGLAERKAEVVLANIQADVLMRHASVLTGAVAPGGALVLSGILAAENARVREAFERVVPGWSVNARVMGEWSDVVLARPQ